MHFFSVRSGSKPLQKLNVRNVNQEKCVCFFKQNCEFGRKVYLVVEIKDKQSSVTWNKSTDLNILCKKFLEILQQYVNIDAWQSVGPNSGFAE